MMYPRLFLARQLLREDGVIFVSIDDNEVYNLRLLMNEILGEENFISQIVWRKVYGGGPKVKYIVDQHEYVLCYARSKWSIEPFELPPDPQARRRYTERDERFTIRGPFFTQPLATTSMDFRPNLRFPIIWQDEEIWPEKQWQWSPERVEKALANNELVFNRQDDGSWSVRYKQYLRDEDGRERPSKPYSVLVGPYTQEGTSEIKEVFGDGKVFPFPKPSSLIKHLVSYAWGHEDAIILDFFAGSSSTAQAVLAFNREQNHNQRFILVQFPEPTSEDAPARREGFETIADIGKARIRRVLAQMETERQGQLPLETRPARDDLGFKVFKLSPSTFRQWEPPEGEGGEALGEQLVLFDRGLEEGTDPTDVIYEVILKLGYSLNATIEPLDLDSNRVYRVTDEEEPLPSEESVPSESPSFHICLDDRLHADTISQLALDKETIFVCLDTAMDDSMKVNLAMQCLLKVI